MSNFFSGKGAGLFRFVDLERKPVKFYPDFFNRIFFSVRAREEQETIERLAY